MCPFLELRVSLSRAGLLTPGKRLFKAGGFSLPPQPKPSKGMDHADHSMRSLCTCAS